MKIRNYTTLLIMFFVAMQFSFAQDDPTAIVDVKTLKSIIDKLPKNTVILDVRTEKEYGTSNIKGAENVNFLSPSFDKIMGAKEKSSTYYVYCFSGGRSQQACEKLRGMGFTSVIDVDKGIRAWTEAGYALEK